MDRKAWRITATIGPSALPLAFRLDGLVNPMTTQTLIFGGADGIGRAIADELARNGGQIHITSRSAEKISAPALMVAVSVMF